MCQGLDVCIDHPRWMVAKNFGLWFVYEPFGFVNVAYFRTWREAFDYAIKRAHT